MHQNFNLLLWGNGEASQHAHWLSYAMKGESIHPTERSLPGKKKNNVILNADLIIYFWGSIFPEMAVWP